MEIADLSWNEVISKRFNNPFLPRSIRGIIVSKSGCGKMTLLLNLLLRPGWLDYENLWVFRKSLFQPEYRILKKAFEENLLKECILRLFNMRDEIIKSQIPPSIVVQEWAKSIKNKSNIKCNFFETASNVPDPRDLNFEDKNLMIFNDLLLERQNKCECYYIRGRHSNVDCFYLSQNYFKLPRQTIRENANFICLFPQDLKNINHIYNDHVGDDMTKEEFRRFCKKCWEKPHGFAVIDLTSKKDTGKYRSGVFLYPNNKMEVELLEKIVKNTTHKTSIQIIVSDNKSSFNTRFNPKLELDRDKVYEIALVNLETYYSFPNIDETNNVFVYSPDKLFVGKNKNSRGKL